jgi:hypothetical protein
MEEARKVEISFKELLSEEKKVERVCRRGKLCRSKDFDSSSTNNDVIYPFILESAHV